MAAHSPSVVVFVLCLTLGTEYLHGQTNLTAAKSQLIERVEKTTRPEQPEVRLFLRLPAGHTAEKPTAKGVLAYCTYLAKDESLRTLILNDSDPLIAFARKHGFAILTWNTATLWRSGKSFDQIKRQEQQMLDGLFDDVARAWERGTRALCKEYGLPNSGFLLYGISRGAHWGGRLALREPERFLAVHIHVANSYDRVVPSAAGSLWLVSSGDLDTGRENAIAFYRLLQGRRFPVILKVANGLGHEENAEIKTLGVTFFDYALQIAKRAVEKTPAELMLEDLKSAGLTGDLLTQEVYRGDTASVVPESQRVPLPDEKVAKAWGFLRK